MDVTKESFWELLPNMMLIIGCSDYIALDMEMTGIKVKDSFPQRPLTMKQVYDRIKAGASTFQAVQVGMTCVRWTGFSYQSFTFTVPISPMFAADTKVSKRMAEIVDRRLTLSYQSLVVLQNHDFNLAETLGQGVPYLGIEELEDVWVEMIQDKTFEWTDPTSLGPWTLKFYTGLAEELRGWLEVQKNVGAVFRVFDPQGGVLRRSTTKLVYQLVREEFPTCRCWRDSDNWAMNIEIKDEKAENKKKQDVVAAAGDAIGKQFALSWLIEALKDKEDLKSYERMGLYPSSYGLDDYILSSLEQDPTKWPRDPHAQWREILQKVEKNKPIIIGHNVIYDMCFLYSMFIGQLPDKVEDLRCGLHRLFPRMVDTKLLVSQTTDPDVVDQSLEGIYADLECQSYPFVSSVPGWKHNRHSRTVGATNGSAHNAGFDSYMAAIVFLKLSTRQLHLQGNAFRSRREQHSQRSRWQDHWLEDPDRFDPYVLSQADPECCRLPKFNSGFFGPVRNRLRMSFAGLLDLEKKPNRRATSGHGSVERALEEEADIPDAEKNILVKMKVEMDRLQELIAHHLGKEEAEGIKDLCQTLGCLGVEAKQKHDR